MTFAGAWVSSLSSLAELVSVGVDGGLVGSPKVDGSPSMSVGDIMDLLELLILGGIGSRSLVYLQLHDTRSIANCTTLW